MSDVAEADLGDFRMVHFVLQASHSSRSRSTATLISGSRLATAATAASGSFERVLDAVIDRGHQEPFTAAGLSLTSFFETMMALE